MKTIRVLSLGAGVQSTALAYLFQNNKLNNLPDFAVFADTKREPPEIYDNLKRLKKEITKFKIHIASKGDLGQYPQKIPFFTKDKKTGKKGMGWRQCTSNYKIQVIIKEVRNILGYKKNERYKHKIETILGISTDEITRMKESKYKWETRRYPLINELKYSRKDCLNYCNELNIFPPRSACYFCPYRSDYEWFIMKKNNPKLFKKACDYDDKIRNIKNYKGYSKYENYTHQSLIPLKQVSFKYETQGSLFNKFGMDNECEGMCGV